MNIRTAKAKGRRLCQKVREMLLAAEGGKILFDHDIRVNPASCPGEDIWLSQAARRIFPIAIECKNQEKAKVWDWIEQARSYSTDGRTPIVMFSRNNEDVYAIVPAKDLIAYVLGNIQLQELKNGKN